MSKTKKTLKQKILVVLGPTAVGKSDVAVKLAKKFNGEVISADSRQVYKGMDIGTGKITKKEMQGVPHYLLDVASPTSRKRFTVAKFQNLAYEAIEDVLKHGKLPIVCGGTGFYIQSIVDGIVLPDVSANEALRKRLSSKSSEQLVKILSKLDKNRLKAIDPRNKFRLIRAIEIATALGKVPSLIKEPKYQSLQIGLDMPDEKLRNKISRRIKLRMKAGMLAEARHLHASGLSYKRMREFGLEYKHLADLLEKKVSMADFEKLLELDIWHYAKRRQRAWFKRDKNIYWFQPDRASDIKKINSLIKAYL